MGIETSADHGDSICDFASVVIIEGLARLDSSVLVARNIVHNALVNALLRKYGARELDGDGLPQLAEWKVRNLLNCCPTAALAHAELYYRRVEVGSI